MVSRRVASILRKIGSSPHLESGPVSRMNRSLPSAIRSAAARIHSPHRRRMWLIFYAILLTFGCSTVSQAQSKPSEYDVKAAYLFNFGKFIRVWPPAIPPKRGSFDILSLIHISEPTRQAE